MFASRHLIFAATLAFQAAALPAADPNNDAEKCWTSKDNHRLSRESAIGHSYTELVSTVEDVSTSIDSDVPLTTLCDGRARALKPYTTILVTVTETLETPTLTTFTSKYTEPSPTCTIAESDCTTIIDNHAGEIKHCTLAPTYPPCAAAADATPWCSINDNEQSTLLYWPVQTTNGDFCNQKSQDTVFAQPTNPPKPNEAVVDGYTFTSPTNYLSYNAISADVYSRVRPGRGIARKQCGGPKMQGVRIPLTEPFYSAKGDESWSYNFADHNTVPADAYSRQYKCGQYITPESCVGVIAPQAEYTPMFLVPDLTNLDPEWKAAGCVNFPTAYDMPRVALATPTPT